MAKTYIELEAALNAVDFWAETREQNITLTKAISAIPAAPVMTKEEWMEKLRAALEKTHTVSEELRAYDGGSEAIKDE